MSTITRLRSINPVQLGIVLGTIYALFSLVAALLILLFGSVLTAPLGSVGGSSFFAIGRFSWTIVVIFPIAYFIAGFLGGIVTAAIYNLVAGWTGGIEFRFEQPS